MKKLAALLLALLTLPTCSRPPVDQSETRSLTMADIASTYSQTIFNWDYWANKQDQMLSTFSEDFVKGLYNPLNIMAKLQGLGALTSTASAVKSFYTVGSVIQASDYVTLLFTYPRLKGLNYDFEHEFSAIADLMRRGTDVSAKAAEIRSRLLVLTQHIDACPSSMLLVSMAGEDAANTARTSARHAVSAALSFLDVALQSATTLRPPPSTISNDLLLGHWQLESVDTSQTLGYQSYVTYHLANLRIDFLLEKSAHWPEVNTDGSFVQKESYADDGGTETKTAEGAYRIEGDRLLLYYDDAKGHLGGVVPKAFKEEWGLNVTDIDTGSCYLPLATFQGNRLALTFLDTANGETYFKFGLTRSSSASSDIRPQFRLVAYPSETVVSNSWSEIEVRFTALANEIDLSSALHDLGYQNTRVMLSDSQTQVIQIDRALDNHELDVLRLALEAKFGPVQSFSFACSESP